MITVIRVRRQQNCKENTCTRLNLTALAPPVDIALNHVYPAAVGCDKSDISLVGWNW